MAGSLFLWGQLLDPAEIGVGFRGLPYAALALLAFA
jgi:hypothetical protein